MSARDREQAVVTGREQLWEGKVRMEHSPHNGWNAIELIRTGQISYPYPAH
jgi:hypothetical protein